MPIASRITVALALYAALACAAEDAPLLQSKTQMLEEKQERIDSGAEALRYDWISPLQLSLSHNEQKGVGDDGFEGVSQASASFSQDLFRSGGIYHAIRYADDKHAYERLGLEQERDGYLSSLYGALTDYRLLQLQCTQAEYLLKNQEIAVVIKRSLYETGGADVTELNDALMERNAQQKSLLELQNSRDDARLELARYSDADPDTLPLPQFVPVDRDTYGSGNYDLALARYETRVAEESYKVTRAGYLPALALGGSATYTRYGDASRAADEGASYSVGLTLSMPLAYNASASVEEKRRDALLLEATASDTRLESLLSYDRSANALRRYEKEIAIAESDLQLYDALIETARKGVETGYRSGYDLQTLQNSRAAAALDVEIGRLRIVAEQLKLYYATAAKETRP